METMNRTLWIMSMTVCGFAGLCVGIAFVWNGDAGTLLGVGGGIGIGIGLIWGALGDCANRINRQKGDDA